MSDYYDSGGSDWDYYSDGGSFDYEHDSVEHRPDTDECRGDLGCDSYIRSNEEDYSSPFDSSTCSGDGGIGRDEWRAPASHGDHSSCDDRYDNAEAYEDYQEPFTRSLYAHYYDGAEGWENHPSVSTCDEYGNCHCQECDRSFENDNNLRMHMNSARHRETSIDCPCCDHTAGTATGLGHHLEREACRGAPMNRLQLHDAVRRYDTQDVISHRLLGRGRNGNHEPVYGPTGETWDPAKQAFGSDIFLRSYNQRHSLLQHQNSPARQQTLYHCPGKDCKRETSTLAGLINHLESGSCGTTTFSDVQRLAQQLSKR